MNDDPHPLANWKETRLYVALLVVPAIAGFVGLCAWLSVWWA